MRQHRGAGGRLARPRGSPRYAMSPRERICRRHKVAAVPSPSPSLWQVPESSPPLERRFGGKTSNSPPPDWLPPGFCVTGCHTVSLLRTLDRERHGSKGRQAAVLVERGLRKPASGVRSAGLLDLGQFTHLRGAGRRIAKPKDPCINSIFLWLLRA